MYRTVYGIGDGVFGLGFLAFVFFAIAYMCLRSAIDAYDSRSKATALSGMIGSLIIALACVWLSWWLVNAMRIRE